MSCYNARIIFFVFLQESLMPYEKIKVPTAGEAIVARQEGSLQVPDRTVVPIIEGDGIGVDVTPVMRAVVDAAEEKSYGARRGIVWKEIVAGEKAHQVYGPDVWLPQETLAALREYSIGFNGPLTSPVGGGIRSLTVALRHDLDLFL